MSDAKTILEELFDRGERLGRSKYTSKDERAHSVMEAKKDLFEELLAEMPKTCSNVCCKAVERYFGQTGEKG